jgi:hypothetical protein
MEAEATFTVQQVAATAFFLYMCTSSYRTIFHVSWAIIDKEIIYSSLRDRPGQEDLLKHSTRDRTTQKHRLYDFVCRARMYDRARTAITRSSYGKG